MQRIVLGILVSLALMIFLASCNSSSENQPGEFTVNGSVSNTAGVLLSGIPVSLLDSQNRIVRNSFTIDGNYPITNVTPGTYTVMATQIINQIMFDTLSEPVTVNDSDVTVQRIIVPTPSDVTFVTRPTLTSSALLAFVRNQAGELVQATVSISGVQILLPSGAPIYVPGVPPGNRTVTITAGTQTITRQNVPFIAGDVMVLNAVINTSTTGTFSISGTVVNSLGQGIAGATVDLFSGNAFIARRTSGVGGTFIFTNLNPGTYNIEVSRIINGQLVVTGFGPVTITTNNVSGLVIQTP